MTGPGQETDTGQQVGRLAGHRHGHRHRHGLGVFTANAITDLAAGIDIDTDSDGTAPTDVRRWLATDRG